MNWFNNFRFVADRYRPSFFFLRKALPINSFLRWFVRVMAPFLSNSWIFFSIEDFSSFDIFMFFGTLVWIVFDLKFHFRPFIMVSILFSSLSFCKSSKKYFVRSGRDFCPRNILSNCFTSERTSSDFLSVCVLVFWMAEDFLDCWGWVPFLLLWRTIPDLLPV